MAELCGEPTKSGKLCNMPKGHDAQFHRHRTYPDKIEWRITSGKSKNVIEFGSGRKELGYAMTRVLNNYSNVLIEIVASWAA